jgi:hypothetical protein
MNVWYAIPSIRRAQDAMQVLNVWRGKGYKVAIQRDEGAEAPPAEMIVRRPYTGYAEAVNHLVGLILKQDPMAQWIVTGGDDLLPDPDATPATVARECREHFEGTLGVMQPTGDRHLEDKTGRCAAERVCISPWLGREWCERANRGNGPLWPEYFHCFVDEELHEVASREKRLWHRRDLTQYHEWYARKRGTPPPPHVAAVKAHWVEAETLFRRRKASGFPGSEILSRP